MKYEQLRINIEQLYSEYKHFSAAINFLST